MGTTVQKQDGNKFQNMKAVTQPMVIPEKDRNRLLLPFGRTKADDYSACISVSNGKIGSIKATIGHREAFVCFSTNEPGHIFETRSFLRYEADEYEISVHENEAGHWLITDYEFDGTFFQTSEMLKLISPSVSQAMTMEKLAS